ncbi:MAG: signal peptide peptidase SppA [Cytophagales bacterium]|nr:signal peptide peptidase SppA [Cytophagales bacterium]
MLQFLKFVLATIVGLAVFMVLAFFLFVGMVSVATSGEKTTVKDNSVLKLKFDRPIVERGRENDPFSNFGPFGEGSPVGLVQIRRAIEDAKNDPNIKGIYLNPDMYAAVASYPTLAEIRSALEDFKKSKKFIVAYSEFYTESSLYLASVADRIYLHPEGVVEWNGLNASVTFLKGTLDKLGVKPEVFKVGDYKSAVEPFLRQDMSEPSREQTRSFLTSVNGHVLQAIGTARGVDVPQLQRLADSLTVREAEDAVTHKLVTALAYPDEVEAQLKKELKLDEKKKVEYISLTKYDKAEKESTEKGSFDKRIAVIFASGEITSGEGSDEVIGSDRIAAALRKAREDDKIKAVVLRINSPGGSALASDVMWREVQLTRKKKPVIASMSDYAASGGYYMAMGCDKIVAHPTTITGSIGVFGLWFNVKDMLNDKLGVTVDGVKTNAYSDLGLPTRNMSETERQWFQKRTESIYADFTQKAAEGRKMKVEDLRKIASGRVWTGEQGKQNGLVDELGGLDKAIEIAANMAKLKPEEYRLRYLPEQKPFFEEFFGTSSDAAETRALQKHLGVLAPYVQDIRQLKNWQGTQARLPFALEIR